MKKTFAILALLVVASVSFANPPVTEKVLKQFSASFPAVKDAKWYENENSYEAFFVKDDMQYHLFYDLSGKVTGSRNYYTADHLAPFIRAKVHEKFADKTIFGVTEITNGEEMFYDISLEDSKGWTNIRVNTIGQVSVLEKMTKAAN